ncbi:hypothetical protein WJX73_005211 [Symbiochloris irregularis]|uniref:F-box domain-containing protein n=1 Tax=Symbiochloris irregularis TaxID=706552 RepID=A0AAW1PDX3_9CHLO
MPYFDWSALPDDLRRRIFLCMPSTEWMPFRQVSHACKDAVNELIGAVAPRQLESSTLQQWQGLKSLSLRRVEEQACDQVKAILPASLKGRELKTLLLPLCCCPCLSRQPASKVMTCFTVKQLILEDSQIMLLSVSQLDQLLGHMKGLSKLIMRRIAFKPVQPGSLQRIPQEWRFTGKLTCLVLDGCAKLPWFYIQSIRFSLTHLELTRCSGTSVSGTLKEAAKLTALKDLSITLQPSQTNQSCRAADFKALSSLHLTYLAMRGMRKFNDDALMALSSLSKLKGLDVTASNITSEGLLRAWHLSTLQSLAATCLSLRPADLQRLLQQCSSLRHLDISSHQCGHTPKHIVPVSSSDLPVAQSAGERIRRVPH